MLNIYIKKFEHILFLFFFLFISCAVQGPPAGGPIDDIPPMIIEVYPSANSVNVDLLTDIYIKFSENMQNISVERSIFITPSLTKELNFRWEGEKLNIENKDGLQSDITYVINVGTSSKDLRDNILKNSFSWAFSTGNKIDTGEISGKIFSEQAPAGILIWGFKIDNNKVIDPSGNNPDYSTQSGENGEFKLEFISDGSYRFFAVNDINNNLKYDIASDFIGLPCCDLKLSDENRKIENFYLPLSVEDTTEIKKSTGDKPLMVEMISFTGKGHPDTAASDISYLFPGDSLAKIPPDTKIKILFNQPVDTSSFLNAFSLIDSDKNEISGNINCKELINFVFSPLITFRENAGYTILIDSTIISGIAGNKMTDGFNLYFETSEPLSFGSISGEIKNIPGNESIIIELINPNNKNEVIRREISNTGRYVINYVRPGEYIISAFVDANKDKTYNYGKSFPFQPSEKFTFISESITVRSGWDNENIDLIFYDYE